MQRVAFSTAIGLFLLLFATVALRAQTPISSGALRCIPLQEGNRCIGFRLLEGERMLADVLFHAHGALYATRVQTRENQLLFSGFRTDGSWEIGDDAVVSVSFTQGNPFPQVAFRIPVKSFSTVVWEATHGKQPLHLFACSMPGAPIFHQRGWVIPTPVIDDHVMHGAFGTASATIVSAWSPDWMYAPAIGAYPMPIVGLWKPDEGKYIAYEFFDARLTDQSERNIGSTYCWQSRQAKQFFCLTLPYAKPYNQLRYPQDGDLFASRFRILYRTSLRYEDDPNRFVNEYIWNTYRQRLTSAPTMNDLLWLPRDYRLERFPTPALGRLLYRTQNDPFSLDGNLESYGVNWDSPIDYVYAQKNQQAIEGLRDDLAQLAQLAQRFTVNGEECVAWRKPLEGDWRPQFGKNVPTLHNVNNWLIALAFLDAYRNERHAEWLPIIDGVVRWSKYILYTRNCYPDVPAAMFAWDAAPIASFLLKYHFTFRDDPQRQPLANLALKLAHNLVYRCLPIFASDNNPDDDIDASFFMEPNSGLPWLGAACANEVWETAVGVLLAYVHTGDPVLGHYLRGMIERFPLLFRDEMYPSVADYGNAFAERYGLYDGTEQPPGTRSTYGGLWGGLEKLIYPIAGTQVRVVCGEKAAMAFNIQGTHTDIAEYRAAKNGNFALRLKGKPPAADADGRYDVVLTSPLMSLRDKKVFINGSEAAVERFAERDDTLLIRGVREGDHIQVGEVSEQNPEVNLNIIKPRVAQENVQRPGFEPIELLEQADVVLNLNWDDNRSMAGFFGGTRTLWGVPFVLLEPALNAGKSAVRQPVRLAHKATMLFALISGEPQSQLRLTYADGKSETVSLESGVPAIQGWPPVLQWRVWMVAHPLKGELRTVTPQNGSLFALTLSDLPEEQLRPTLASLQQQREQYRQQQQALKRWQQVVDKLKPLGSVAVLPAPGASPQGHPLYRAINRAGAMDLLRLLSPHELVTPSIFNPMRFPLAFYLGGENYYQTVREPQDGDRAMANYLRNGGTLLVSPTQPFPFYYNERGAPVVFAPKIGMPVSSSGAEGREDLIQGKEVRGWERPPQGVSLRFVRNPKQQIVTGLLEELPFPTDGDLRWRPMVNIWDEQEAQYTPVLTLKDSTGKEYGEGIALVEFKSGEFRGARILYIWHRLIADPEWAVNILSDVLSYLATMTPPPPKQVVVPQTTAAPIIDGKLDDAAWQSAAQVELRWRFNPANAPALIALTPTVRTTARLLWDKQFLYVGFECEDPDVWSVYTQRDAYVWEGEAAEVYLDPSGRGQNYKEIDLNPLGALIDLNTPEAKDGNPGDVEQNARWNARGVRWATSINGTVNDRNDRDTGWTAELAIPLKEVLNEEEEQVYVGDAWRAQFYRIERPKDSTDATTEFQAWSPTDTFHRPERFGVILFGGSPKRVDFSLYRPGSDGSPTFTVISGLWKTRDGVYEGRNCIEDGWLPRGAGTGDNTWRDYTVKIRYRLVSRGSDWRDGFWVGFRYGEQACYALLLTGRDAQLHKVPIGRTYDGDRRNLMSAPFTPDAEWHNLLIRVRGGSIEVQQDAKPLIQYTDESPLAAGGVVLCARKWSGSTGDTVVEIAQFEVE